MAGGGGGGECGHTGAQLSWSLQVTWSWFCPRDVQTRGLREHASHTLTNTHTLTLALSGAARLGHEGSGTRPPSPWALTEPTGKPPESQEEAARAAGERAREKKGSRASSGQRTRTTQDCARTPPATLAPSSSGTRPPTDQHGRWASCVSPADPLQGGLTRSLLPLPLTGSLKSHS